MSITLLLDQRCVGHQYDFHQSKAKERFIFAGNRAGKTEAGGREVAFYATGFHPFLKQDNRRPTIGWVCGLDRDICLTILMPKILKFIPPELILPGNRGIKKGDVPEINLRDGSQIRFKSVAAGRTKFQSAEIDYAWFDEEPPEDVYEEVMMRLIDRKGRVWTTMTPLQGKTWLYHKYVKNKRFNDPKRIALFSWSIYDNDTLDREEIEITLAGIPEHLRPAREKGHWIDLVGLIWPNFDEDVHVIDKVRLERHWPIGIAMDPGAAHKFAATVGAVTDRSDLIVFTEYFDNFKTVRNHASGIVDVLKEHCPWILKHRLAGMLLGGHNNRGPVEDTTKNILTNETTVIDPSALQFSIELAVYGLQPSKANRNMEAGLNRVGEKLELARKGLPGGLYFVRGETNHHIDQIRTYSWKVKPDGTATGEPQDTGDDCCDSLRYLAQENMEPTPLEDRKVRPGTLEYIYRTQELADEAEKLMGNERANRYDLEEMVEELWLEKGF